MQASELLHDIPPTPAISAAEVAAAVPADTVHIVLDDDPTGTQPVADLPVLTRWTPEDLDWALAQERPAVYVLTNSRSLDPEATRERTLEVVTAASDAAVRAGKRVRFVSRSDSTLRGHFPLETDVLAAAIADHGGARPSFTVLIPAFPDAGRVTVHGVHYWIAEGEAVPVGQTPFAEDATFGFHNSFLPAWVEEKTGGRIRSAAVLQIPIEVIRSGVEGIITLLDQAPDDSIVVPDVVAEEDMRAIALALHALDARGRSSLLRIGPPHLRAHIGQAEPAPAPSSAITTAHDGGGLIVIGSHVPLTTAQLAHLRAAHPSTRTIELEVAALLGPEREDHLSERLAEAVEAIAHGDVIVHTSRTRVTGDTPEASLEIARRISAALVAFVARLLEAAPPRFVIAKGGITSSDTASEALQIARATVIGPMLPGIVSLWQPRSGPAQGIPYIVFAGNVGAEDSLTAVVERLSTSATKENTPS